MVVSKTASDTGKIGGRRCWELYHRPPADGLLTHAELSANGRKGGSVMTPVRLAALAEARTQITHAGHVANGRKGGLASGRWR